VWRTSPVAAFGGPGDRALWTLTFVLFVSLVASVFVIFVA
jgi:hypothetical protein